MRYRKPVLILLLPTACLACLALLLATAWGQTPDVFGQVEPSGDSIEWHVAVADLVVRGTVQEVSPRQVKDRSCLKIVLRVTETIKGPKEDQVAFIINSEFPELETQE